MLREDFYKEGGSLWETPDSSPGPEEQRVFIVLDIEKQSGTGPKPGRTVGIKRVIFLNVARPMAPGSLFTKGCCTLVAL